MAQFSTTPVYPNIGAFVAAASLHHGDQVAVDCFEDDERVTYLQLDELSNRFANALLACGVRKGVHVAVMLPNRREYPLTWIALAKLGAVMVPIETTLTARELQYVLDDSQSEFLMIGEEFLPAFDAMSDRPSRLDNKRVVVRGEPTFAGMRSWEAMCKAGSSRLPDVEPIGPDDSLGLQYTSGSTGKPKGCVVSQEYWMLLGRSLRALMSSPVKRILSPNPFSYMNGRNLLLTAMEVGGTLFLARKPSISRFMDWVHRYGIEWCWFPQLVLKQPERDDDARTNLKEVGTAAYSREAHSLLEKRFKVPAREIYGMTEVGAALAMPAECSGVAGSGSMGIPMLARKASVRSPDGTVVETGEAGELWIAGPSMLKGYFNRPDANADAFRGEWFRTGDLARRDADGFFYFLGRAKDIVRRNSQNISAREVEEVARAIEEVEDAAVVPVPDEERGEEVKIYVSLRNPAIRREDMLAMLISHFTRNLASYKVPRYYQFVSEFPRTPSNKIDKKSLKGASADLRAGTFDREKRKWI